MLKTARRSMSEGREKSRQLLQRLVLPLDNEPADSNLANPNLRTIYKNWGLNPDESLPRRSPIKVSPIEFAAKTSREFKPRLSVTKLLTDRWCELAKYYEIYAELKFQTTPAVSRGLKLHERLEKITHVEVDTGSLTDALLNNFEQLLINNSISLNNLKPGDKVLVDGKYVSIQDYLNLAFGNVQEGELSENWADCIISRLFSLFTTSQAREVLVHGFADFNTQDLCTKIPENSSNEPLNLTLVSGIVDEFRLINTENPQNLDLFEEIDHELSLEFDDYFGDNQVIDLTKFFEIVKPLVELYDYKIIASDVKTRSLNSLPNQKSQLDSAMVQTFYYRKLLGLLSGESTEKNFSYYSLLENAKQRGADIDAPISYDTITQILRKFPYLFLEDFIKLANGKDIGFAPFDEFRAKKGDFNENIDEKGNDENGTDVKAYVKGTDVNADVKGNDKKGTKFHESKADSKINNHTEFNYNLGDYIYGMNFGLIDDFTEFEYDKIYVNLILKKWDTPPTLRYFAARSAQFYELCFGMLGNSTTVEYYNSTTGKVFSKLEYQYDEEVVVKNVENGVGFWSGIKEPTPVDDVSKCNYCEFASKCKIPNYEYETKKRNIGSEIFKFLEE